MQKLGLSVVVRFGGLGLQFAGSILIARALGVEGFGAYSYAFTWAVILGTVITLGFAPLAVRELPRFVVAGDHGLLRGYLRVCAVVVLGVGTLVALMLAGLEAAGLLVLSVGWPLVALAALAQSVLLVLVALLTGLQKIILAQLVETLLRQGVFLGPLLVLLYLGHVFLPAEVFRLAVISVVLMLPVLTWLIWREMGRQVAPWQTRRSIAAEYGPWLWVGMALPLLATTLANQMQTNLAVIMVGYMGDDADVGRYRTASRAVDLVLIANALAIQVLGPMLSRALARKDRAEAQQLMGQAALAAFGLGALVCLVLAVWSDLYLGLFGPDFLAARTTLRILLIAQILGLICGPVAVVMVMLRRERMVLALSLTSLAVNFCLNWALIPAYGIEGAAVATLCAVLTFKGGLLIVVLRQTGFDPAPFGLGRRLGMLRPIPHPDPDAPQPSQTRPPPPT